MMENFRWLINRLLAMSLSELFARMRMHLIKTIWRIRIPDYNGVQISSFSEQSRLYINAERIEGYQKTELIREAERYLNHQWFFFGIDNYVEKHIDWHKDFVSGVSAPQVFGFSINHRDEKIVGNIKITWEKNRHHHLTIMSVAYYLTNDERFAFEVITQIKSWIHQNPYLIGVNWTHPLEQGIRLISWIYCERFLRGSKYYNELFNNDSIFWKSFYEHQKFIYHTYSRGSSANNHLIGEMAGLFISSLVWPIFKESREWMFFSMKILEREIKKQTYPSGINKELAFSYQIFVLEFLLLCLIETRNSDIKFSIEFKNLLTKVIKSTRELKNSLSIIPNYGDGDEGRAIQLSSENEDRVEWLIETGTAILDLEIPLLRKNNIQSVLLNSIAPDSQIVNEYNNGNCFFADSGIFILRHPGRLNITVFFDAGPLGFGSLAAHGHADALSFTLSVNNTEFFIDPGTYCYHTEYKNRKYFRSSSAHNTLTINKEDQSVQLGPFIWGRKANVSVKKISLDMSHIQASHDGYKKWGIRHIRDIRLLNDKLVICDEVLGKNNHFLDFRFHLHPNVKLEKRKGYLLLKNNDILVLLYEDSGCELNIINSSNNGGWYSPQFNVKVATTTLSYQKKLYLPTKQIFSIEIKKR